MTARDSRPKPQPEELERRFRALRSWNQGGKWSPKKPLLVVWMIGRCIAGEERLVPYVEVDRELSRLWAQFGPPRPVKSEQPFWRLQRDDVWEVPEAHLIKETVSKDAYVSYLRKHNATGGFPKDIFDALQNNKELAFQIARDLVAAHFPDTRHDEILKTVGAETEYITSRRRARDPSFRPAVLQAYDYRCVVCELSIAMNNVPIAIEAAHIKWHQANGPDKVGNGLSLCNLHHRLLDAGAFTASLEGTVRVSPFVQGPGMNEVLGKYATKPLLLPSRAVDAPDPAFLEWHRKQVYRGKAP